MSEHVDLGQLRIKDKSSGLSCTIGGTASFTRLDDNIQDLSESSFADRLSTFGAWISTGGSVRLVIEAVLDEHDGHGLSIADIQRDLARLLSESTVWELLDLRPSVTTSHVETGEFQGRIIVELAPSGNPWNDPDRSTRRQAPYRLTGRNVIRDTKPPKGIALYATKEITLVMTVHNPFPFTDKNELITTSLEVPRSSPLFPTVGQEDGYEEVEEMELDQEADPRSQLVQIQHDESTIWTDDDNSSPSLETHSVYAPSHASCEETSDRLGVTTKDVVKIMVEAVKVKMFSSIARSPDIHVGKGSDMSCLANLFPSIWRPDFLKEVASRSGFIPSIASSLACGNIRSSRGGTGSMHYLSEQERDSASHVRRTDVALAAARFQGPIAVRLWKTVCNQAFRKTHHSFRQKTRRTRRVMMEHDDDHHNLFEGVMVTNDEMFQRDDEDNGHYSPEKEHLFWDLESLGSSMLFSPKSQQDEEPSQVD